MKYIVLLGDGMSDEKLPQLGDKTPLQAARTPHMDYMAKRGKFGLVSFRMPARRRILATAS